MADEDDGLRIGDAVEWDDEIPIYVGRSTFEKQLIPRKGRIVSVDASTAAVLCEEQRASGSHQSIVFAAVNRLTKV